MKNILCLFILFAITGCTKITASTFDVTKPGSPQMRWIYDGPPTKKGAPPPEPLYIQGWKDGCETGASANTNAFYKYFQSFKQDATLSQNPVYYKGWRDAFFYCGRYIYQYNRRIGF